MSEICKHSMGQLEPLSSASSLKYPPELMEVISALFLEHGGSITDIDDRLFLAHFPPGTTFMEIYPRIRSVRYEVTFPDGFLVQLVVARDGQQVLQFPLSSFSEELQERYLKPPCNDKSAP